MSWSKISLAKFQQIDAVNAKKNVSEIDKVLFSVCIVFGLTEYQLDNAGVKKANKLIEKVTKIFTAPFDPLPQKRIGQYFINYDVSKMTFGQYVELSLFLQNPIPHAHYTMASISNKWLRPNTDKDHRKKSEYFLKQPITKIMGGINLIIKSFTEFNNEYKSLFGLDKEVYSNAQADPFNKVHGWKYSAEQVAEYERITLDQAYQLPVRQALNDLAYLKAKAKYEFEQSKKK